MLEIMNIPSPFDGLDLDRELVCEFFGVFSRFEYALKESGLTRDVRGIVEPAWWRFAENMNGWLTVEPDSALAEAIDFLCDEPAQVQTGPHNWEMRALHGKMRLEHAIDAARRVRHNLFHGGKHTPHSPPGKDERLVRSALALLYSCLEQNTPLREIYMQNKF
jgi:hypothetical protein